MSDHSHTNDHPEPTYSDTFLKAILDSIEDTMVVFDNELNYLLVNKAACRLLSKTAAELVGKNLLELFPTLIASTSHRCLLKALSGESIVSAISEGTFTKEGAKYISNYSPVFKNGKVEAVVVITKRLNLSDIQITDLLKNNHVKILEDRINELQDFIDHVAVPFHWVNGSGIIIWANDAELQMMGYTKEEYIGSHIANFHADAKVIDDILRKLLNKETLVNYPARLKTKNGEIKQVLISSSVFRKDGEFVHTRCFTREIDLK
ncbi:MAG: PAS domain-containing protein [Bacteroidia bacterium]